MQFRLHINIQSDQFPQKIVIDLKAAGCPSIIEPKASYLHTTLELKWSDDDVKSSPEFAKFHHNVSSLLSTWAKTIKADEISFAAVYGEMDNDAEAYAIHGFEQWEIVHWVFNT